MDFLPDEVLLSILRLACAENALYTYSFARVSRQWRRLCKNSSVLRAIDLSVSLPLALDGSSSHRRHTCVNDALLLKIGGPSWSELSELNVAGCPITDAAIHQLAATCRHLRVLRLGGGCKKQRVSPSGLQALGQACGATLESLSLSGSISPALHTPAALHAFLPPMRALTSLDLSRCAGAGSLQGLRAVAESLPLLRELDLSLAGSAVTASVPILELQRGCPLLQVLDISGLGGAPGWLPVLTLEAPAGPSARSGDGQQPHEAAGRRTLAGAGASAPGEGNGNSSAGRCSSSGDGAQQRGPVSVSHPSHGATRQQQEHHASLQHHLREQHHQNWNPNQNQNGNQSPTQRPHGSPSVAPGLAPGFPCLRVLRAATSVHMSSTGLRHGNSRVDDKVLAALVGRSPRLEVLEVGGIVGLTPSSVGVLPTCQLAELSIKKCGRGAGQLAAAAAARWGASLVRLDVSENTCVGDEEVVDMMRHFQVLGFLDLAGTAVGPVGIRAVLGSTCGATGGTLRSISTRGCRSLPRELRREGVSEMEPYRRAASSMLVASERSSKGVS